MTHIVLKKVKVLEELLTVTVLPYEAEEDKIFEKIAEDAGVDLNEVLATTRIKPGLIVDGDLLEDEDQAAVGLALLAALELGNGNIRLPAPQGKSRSILIRTRRGSSSWTAVHFGDEDECPQGYVGALSDQMVAFFKDQLLDYPAIDRARKVREAEYQYQIRIAKGSTGVREAYEAVEIAEREVEQMKRALAKAESALTQAREQKEAAQQAFDLQKRRIDAAMARRVAL